MIFLLFIASSDVDDNLSRLETTTAVTGGREEKSLDALEQAVRHSHRPKGCPVCETCSQPRKVQSSSAPVHAPRQIPLGAPSDNRQWFWMWVIVAGIGGVLIGGAITGAISAGVR